MANVKSFSIKAAIQLDINNIIYQHQEIQDNLPEPNPPTYPLLAGTLGLIPGTGLYESELQHLAVDVFMTPANLAGSMPNLTPCVTHNR